MNHYTEQEKLNMLAKGAKLRKEGISYVNIAKEHFKIAPATYATWRGRYGDNPSPQITLHEETTPRKKYTKKPTKENFEQSKCVVIITQTNNLKNVLGNLQ